jgi:hypothetical protein
MPRKKSQIKTDRLNFWLPNDLYEQVKSVAAAKGWTITEAARNLLAEGLEIHGKPTLREEVDEIKRRLDMLSNSVLGETQFLPIASKTTKDET